MSPDTDFGVARLDDDRLSACRALPNHSVLNILQEHSAFIT